jgi:transcriptional regulator GlxA family with amidase domain
MDAVTDSDTGSNQGTGRAGLRVDILVFEQARMYDLATALEVFSDRSDRGLPRQDVRLVGSQPRVSCDSGATIELTGFADTPDLLIVPGSDRRLGRLDEEELAWIRRAYEGGAIVAGLCTGAFALAEAGLLDGRRATTHWRFASALGERFPTVDVAADEIFVGGAGVWTSAGVSAGADLLIHLVETILGATVAGVVARSMVIPLRRSGNQAQFIDYEVENSAAEDFRLLEDRVRSKPYEDWSVARFATELGLSKRTCYRTFASLLGTSPHDWLIGLRLDVARLLLESTSAPIEIVAADSGMGTQDNLRKHFASRFGLSPRDYRARFAPTF